ncbi:hypothetical protein TcWFU_010538 [Taenia crassiceps]|uniref:Uncharacterized protein n=1 Tax=Taenia crassiceps TaxID=6207 RepID=A0ABR4QFR3_9CEST
MRCYYCSKNAHISNRQREGVLGHSIRPTVGCTFQSCCVPPTDPTQAAHPIIVSVHLEVSNAYSALWRRLKRLH